MNEVTLWTLLLLATAALHSAGLSVLALGSSLLIGAKRRAPAAASLPTREAHSDIWEERVWKWAIFGCLITVPLALVVSPTRLTLPGEWATSALVQDDAESSRSTALHEPVDELTHAQTEVADTPLTNSPEERSQSDGGALSSEPAMSPTALLAPSRGAFWSAIPFLLLGWALVATLLLARLVIDSVAARFTLTRNAQPAPAVVAALAGTIAHQLEVSGVNVLVSKNTAVPLALPGRVILLPRATVRDATKPELEAILAHEIAHFSRHDLWWRAGAQAMVALLWFQPLLWLAKRRMEQLAETRCDLRALDVTKNPLPLARALMRVAEQLVVLRPRRSAGAGMADGTLGTRVRRVLAYGADLEHQIQRPASRWVATVSGVIFLTPALFLPNFSVGAVGPLRPEPSENAQSAGQRPGGADAVLREAASELGARPGWIAFGLSSEMRDEESVIHDSGGYDLSLLDGPALGSRFYGKSWGQASENTLGRSSQGDDSYPTREIAKDVIAMLHLNRDGNVDRVAMIDGAYGQNFLGQPVVWRGRIDDRTAYDLLRDLFDRESDAELRAAFADAVGLLNGVGDSTPWLADLARTSPDFPVRAAAAEALHWTPFPGRADLLIDLALTDAEPRVWTSAIETLGLLGEEGRVHLEQLARDLEEEPRRGRVEEILERRQ